MVRCTAITPVIDKTEGLLQVTKQVSLAIVTGSSPDRSVLEGDPHVCIPMGRRVATRSS